MERFWSKVEKTSGCWEWRAFRNARGYGQFGVGSLRDGTRRLVLAHRFAYEEERGPIPQGLELDHLCRNPACVRPDHLEPVPHAENVRRGSKAQATHCVAGHAFSQDNTYRHPRTGRRTCKECRRRRLREHYARTKAGAAR